MKHSNGKSVIASMYNAQQVRVFIPEKLSIDGQMYVVPFVINKMSVNAEQQYKVWGSAWGVIRILFEHVSMSMTSAFTESSLNTVMRFILSDRNRSKSSGRVFTLSKSEYEALL